MPGRSTSTAAAAAAPALVQMHSAEAEEFGADGPDFEAERKPLLAKPAVRSQGVVKHRHMATCAFDVVLTFVLIVITFVLVSYPILCRFFLLGAAPPPGEPGAWAELGRTFTLHVSVVVDDSQNLAQVPMYLVLYKVCFAEVYVVVDVPHGGCNYQYSRTSGGPSSWSAFFKSSAKTELVDETERMLKRARDIHDNHCKKPLQTRVEVIDYKAKETVDLWREAFDLGFEPATESQATWPWAFMWKNTMNYLIGIMRSKGEFVLHADDDFGILSDDNTGISRLLTRVIKEMDGDQKVVFAQLTPCGEPGRNDERPEKVLDGITVGRYAPTNDGLSSGSYISMQFFVSSPQRLRLSFPLGHWRDFTESVFQLALSAKTLLSDFVEVPGLCKDSYKTGLQKTPLTDAEKLEGKYEFKQYSSHARPEQFNLNEPHAPCNYQ